MAKRKGERPLWDRKPASRRPGQTRDRGGLDRQTRRAIERQIAASVTSTGDKLPRPAMSPLRATQAFRFRKQMQPLWWASWTACGWFFWQAHSGLVILAIAAALVAILTGVFSTTGYHQVMALWCGTWAVVLAEFGPGWWMAIWFTAWLIPSGIWIHRHRWRPQAAPKVIQIPAAAASDTETFAELAKARSWHAWLDNPQPIPNGVTYTVCCRGTRTHMDTILAEPSAVAAAFNASVDQVYTEGDRSGIKSRGTLTKLTKRTLAESREWDRRGIDPSTGLAVIGRFPDGTALHERVHVPGNGGGARHTIVAGAPGSGKTGKLDLGLCNSAISGYIAPVILDPQEGQALPAWRDHVPYARGITDCMIYLAGLRNAMMARSRDLADLPWANPVTGKTRKGLGFFDYQIVAQARARLGLPPLPLVEVTIDEAPILLACPGAVEMVLEIGKLGRKVGFRLVLAAQVPSIAELGQQELRSMLVGGNVILFRTGDKVSGGMLNIQADPWELPKEWADGTPTVGLGYSDGPDQRSSTTCRTDWVPDPYEIAETAEICRPDDQVAGSIAAAVATAAAEAGELNASALTSSSAQSCVLRQLSSGQTLTRGALVSTAMRDSGMTLSQITDAITGLVASGRIVETSLGFRENK
jgi:hypothetical protein